MAPPEINAELQVDPLVSALKMYQEMMGLNQTGVLDQATMTEMAKPRCGNEDMNIHAEPQAVHHSRAKRFTLQGVDYIVEFTFISVKT